MPKIELQINSKNSGANLLLTVQSDWLDDIDDFVGRIRGGYRLMSVTTVTEN